ncbi:MAG: peptide chain release factor-like protein [Saprospiraceae bacterium]
MDIELLKSELRYRSARSGGKGGQHVNKVETKVEARLNVRESQALSEEEKALVLEKLEAQVSAEGYLSTTDQSSRSQLTNKRLAEEKMIVMLTQALKRPKKRKKTRVPQAARVARTDMKKKLSEKKSMRRGKFGHEE